MKIRQEEESPIGNCFHDSGVWTIFNAISSTVDDFEIDSDQLSTWCDFVIKSMKQLQNQIKDCEKKQIKKMHEREIDDKINRGME